MKILNKKELQQIALSNSTDTELKDFIKIYKKCTGEPYSFLVNDIILPSNNPLRIRKNHLNIYIYNIYIYIFIYICNKIMAIDDQIEDEKLQHDINREAAKKSDLSSGKIDK